MWESKTFSDVVTATAYASYQPLQFSKTAGQCGGPQVGRVLARGTASATANAATVRFVLVKDGVPIYYEDATITPTAVVSGSGGRVGTVVFTGNSGNNKIDLLGARPSYGGSGRCDSYAASQGGAAVWMYAPITSMGDWSDLTLEIAASPEV